MASGGRETEDPLEERIEAARRGDPEAIAEFCRHFEPLLRGFVSRSAGAKARRWVDPEDIAQTVMFETLRALPSWPPNLTREEVLRRLRRAANSRVCDSLRAHQRDIGDSLLGLEARDPGSPASGSGTVTRADTHRWLTALVERLPANYADAVRLVLEGMSYEQAGEVLGIGADAVRKRYERAVYEIKRRRPRDD